MTPYYDDGTCQCGCGAAVTRRFVSGHNLRTLERRDGIVVFDPETGSYRRG